MRFKTMFCLLPKRLAINEGEEGMRFVGWVWMQRAYLTKNIHHGWVAFLNNQTSEYLDKCPCCKRAAKGGK